MAHGFKLEQKTYHTRHQALQYDVSLAAQSGRGISIHKGLQSSGSQVLCLPSFTPHPPRSLSAPGLRFHFETMSKANGKTDDKWASGNIKPTTNWGTKSAVPVASTPHPAQLSLAQRRTPRCLEPNERERAARL
eukprot:3803251-Rhodomonas_salina.1